MVRAVPPPGQVPVRGVDADFFQGARSATGDNIRPGAGTTPPPLTTNSFVGGWPGDLAAIPATHIMYVTDDVGGEASFFGRRRDSVSRKKGCARNAEGASWWRLR